MQNNRATPNDWSFMFYLYLASKSALEGGSFEANQIILTQRNSYLSFAMPNTDKWTKLDLISIRKKHIRL